jgi:hypothetical protein
LLKDSLLLCREREFGCPARFTSAVLATVAQNITAIRGAKGLFRALTAWHCTLQSIKRLSVEQAEHGLRRLL